MPVKLLLLDSDILYTAGVPAETLIPKLRNQRIFQSNKYFTDCCTKFKIILLKGTKETLLVLPMDKNRQILMSH